VNTHDDEMTEVHELQEELKKKQEELHAVHRSMRDMNRRLDRSGDFPSSTFFFDSLSRIQN